MTIYMYTIPITNYSGDAPYEKKIFIEGDQCPTKGAFLEVIEGQYEIEKADLEKYPDHYQGTIPEIFEVWDLLQTMEKYPRLSYNQIQANSFVHHPKFGRLPFSILKVVPFQVPRNV